MRMWRDYLGSSVDEAANDIDWVLRTVIASAPERKNGSMSRLAGPATSRRRPPGRCCRDRRRGPAFRASCWPPTSASPMVSSWWPMPLTSSPRSAARFLVDAAADLGIGPFAVRSSGVTEDGVDHSFAGMYESVLDVSTEEVPAAVDRCLASARAARVAEYVANGEGRLAVIVQRMVAPIAAGVALTADPVNGDRSTSWSEPRSAGGGDRLVSGACRRGRMGHPGQHRLSAAPA